MRFRNFAIFTLMLFAALLLFQPLFAEESDFNKYYNNAEKLLLKGRYAESLAEIDKALAVAGNDDETLKALRYKYRNTLNLCNYSEAAKIPIEVLKREHLTDELKREWFNNLINDYIQAGKRDEAIAECDKYIASASPILKDSAYHRKYDIYRNKNNFDDALKVADAALKQESLNDEQRKNWLQNRVMGYYSAKRFDEAIAECDKLIASAKPEIRAIGFNYKYDFYRSRDIKDDKEKALKVIDGALIDTSLNNELRSKWFYAEWLLKRIQICSSLERIDEAIADCDRLLNFIADCDRMFNLQIQRLLPLNVLSLKFTLCMDKKDYVAALKVTEEALLKNKDIGYYRNYWFDNRIQVYIRAKWFDEAIADIDKYKSEPEKLQLKKRVYAAKYKFYQERKDYENALKTTGETLKLKNLTYDENNQWHTNQINTYIAAEKFNEAITEIKKLMSLSGPLYERTCISLLKNAYSAQKRYYSNMGKIDEAAKVIDEMLGLNCFNSELKAEWLRDRGYMFLNARRYDEAIADADRLIVFNSPLFLNAAYTIKYEAYSCKKDYAAALKVVDEASKQQNEWQKKQWLDNRFKIYFVWGRDGDAKAQYELGNCYRDAIGVANDKVNAEKWYRKAVEQGLPEAKAALEKLKNGGAADCLKTKGQSSIPDESFESLKEKVLVYSNVKYPGKGYIDGNYSMGFFSLPFQKCMESVSPLHEESLIHKMFYDAQMRPAASEMICKYIKNAKNPSDKRQMLFNFLLKNMAIVDKPFVSKPAGPFNKTYLNDLESKLQPVSPLFILASFSDKKYYNDDSKQIIKDLLLKKGCKNSTLFLIDVAGIYDDPEINKFLKDNAAKCKGWGINNEWYALLILANHGDKEAVKKVVEIAKKPVQSDIRRDQVHGMPLQLAYIQQPEIVELLKEFLPSKESYWVGHDAVPQAQSLSHSSARALSSMIKGYPKVNVWQYTDEQRKSCIEWFDKNKTYEFAQNNDFSQY